MSAVPLVHHSVSKAFRLPLLLVLFTLLTAAATAQAAVPAAAPAITLAEAVSKTLADNPGLRAEGYVLNAQEGRILQTGVKPAPELLVMVENVLGSGENDLVRGAQTTFSIAWFLERGVRETRVASERAALDLLVIERDVSRLDAAAVTARLYLNSLALQTEMINAEIAITQAEVAVEAVSARVDAGAVPAAELARARAELAQRELVREDIEHETLASYHRLAAQWGMTTPDFSSVAGDVMQLPNVQDFAALQARIAENPSISRFLSQQRLYEAQLALAEVSHKSPWRVSAGVRQIETTGDHAFVADFSMPLTSQRNNRGRLEEARANLARTEMEKEAEQVHIETELYVIYLELQHFLHVATALRDNIIPLLESALTETQTAYEQGRYSYLELASIQTELLTARSSLVIQSVEARRRLIEIERFTGLTIEANQP